jgi:hypothetical protein
MFHSDRDVSPNSAADDERLWFRIRRLHGARLTSITVADPGTDHSDGGGAAYVMARSLRLHREWLVAEMASGMSLADLQDEDASDARVGTVKVVVLAEAVPTAGKVQARRAMAALGIPTDARWGELALSTAAALWRRLTATDADAGPE